MYVSHVEELHTPCFRLGEETVCPLRWLVENPDRAATGVGGEHAFSSSSRLNCAFYGVCGKVWNLQWIGCEEGKKWTSLSSSSSSGLAVGFFKTSLKTIRLSKPISKSPNTHCLKSLKTQQEKLFSSHVVADSSARHPWCDTYMPRQGKELKLHAV